MQTAASVWNEPSDLIHLNKRAVLARKQNEIHTFFPKARRQVLIESVVLKSNILGLGIAMCGDTPLADQHPSSFYHSGNSPSSISFVNRCDYAFFVKKKKNIFCYHLPSWP